MTKLGANPCIGYTRAAGGAQRNPLTAKLGHALVPESPPSFTSYHHLHLRLHPRLSRILPQVTSMRGFNRQNALVLSIFAGALAQELSDATLSLVEQRLASSAKARCVFPPNASQTDLSPRRITVGSLAPAHKQSWNTMRSNTAYSIGLPFQIYHHHPEFHLHHSTPHSNLFLK